MNQLIRIAACFSASLGLMVALAPSEARADVPNLLNHQGRLYDASGAPVTGPVDMEFALYDAELSPTAIWSEISLPDSSVAAFDGAM